VNELLLLLGAQDLKPYIGALLLPPVPFLLLVLVGVRVAFNKRGLGWALVLLAVAGIWLSTTSAAGHHLRALLLKPPPVLQPADVAALRRAPQTAIVVLGGGRSPPAQEYGTSQLHPRGIERLRYGIHLSRRTGLPLAFSGGVGWGAVDGVSEADLAGRLAQDEFNFKLRWLEGQARDTRENASRTVPLLREAGIRHIVLVTHDYHMPRAGRAFREAITASGVATELTLAPMGVGRADTLRVNDWLPSLGGTQDTRLVLHELLGRLLGA